MDLAILEEQMGRIENRKSDVGGQLRRASCSYTQSCESGGKLSEADSITVEELVKN